MTEITRYSMVKSYRRCPKQYSYKYIQKIQKKKPAPPLLRGTILHEMLDARATQGRPGKILADYAQKFRTLFREEQDIYGENFIGDIERIYSGYDALYANDGWKYEASEELLETELTPDIRFVGHLDKRIVTQKDRRRWIVDHKTHKSLPDEEHRFNDYQILLYLWAYNREHPKERADGIIWDYLRTKPPRIPELLKNGQLSQRADMDTDYNTYARELRRHKLDPRPYENFLLELKKRSERKFYLRIPLPAPSKEMTEQVVKDFTQTSQIMHGLKVYPRTMTRDCSWCEYFKLCSAELRGLDAKYIEKTEFEEREVDDYATEED